MTHDEEIRQAIAKGLAWTPIRPMTDEETMLYNVHDIRECQCGHILAYITYSTVPDVGPLMWCEDCAPKPEVSWR
jgi:hypothetical protein